LVLVRKDFFPLKWRESCPFVDGYTLDGSVTRSHDCIQREGKSQKILAIFSFCIHKKFVVKEKLEIVKSRSEVTPNSRRVSRLELVDE
jgi:hypothetical protein